MLAMLQALSSDPDQARSSPIPKEAVEAITKPVTVSVTADEKNPFVSDTQYCLGIETKTYRRRERHYFTSPAVIRLLT
jgi:hypothetical protein